MFLGSDARTVWKRSVSDDWINALPREKSQVFDAVVSRWESVYAMMSVSLDSSLSLRARGELICARQQVEVTVELFDRIASSLILFCDTVGRQSQHLRRYPAVEPLNSEFFRGITGQHAASKNSLLHRILIGGRSRFHRKVRILSETLKQLEQEFRGAAAAIETGVSAARSAEAWKSLDCIHYDFNTCLRENEILLKSFLRALPAQHIAAFGASMGISMAGQALSAHPDLFGASA